MPLQTKTSTATPPNTERIAGTCGVYIDDFQSLFKFHKIKTGSPEFFPKLASILDSKKSLRSDFFRLAVSIRQKEGGTFSDADMLTVVALALGGPEVGGTRGEVKIPLDVLTAYTSGVAEREKSEGQPLGGPGGSGMAAEYPELTELGRASQGRAGATEMASEGTSELSIGERLALRQAAFAARSAGPRNGYGTGPAERPGPEEVAESYGSEDSEAMEEERIEVPARLVPKISGTLERLALDSNELRQHLADIERRLSQMEPHPELRAAAAMKPAAEPPASAEVVKEQAPPLPTVPEVTAKTAAVPAVVAKSAVVPASVAPVRAVVVAAPVVVPAAVSTAATEKLAESEGAGYVFSAAADHRFSAAMDSVHPGALPAAGVAVLPASPDVRRLRYAVMALGLLLALVMAFGGTFAYRFYSLRAAQQRAYDSSTSGRAAAEQGSEIGRGGHATASSAVPGNAAPVAGQVPGQMQKPVLNAKGNPLARPGGVEQNRQLAGSNGSAQSVPATVNQAGTAAPIERLTPSGVGRAEGAPPISQSVMPAQNGLPTVPQGQNPAVAAQELLAKSEPATPAKGASTSPAPAPAGTSRGSGGAESGASPTGGGATAVSGPARPISVPSAVMMRNALSSRKPEYPSSARAYSIQGTVVVETLISKNGTVESARAISGPSILRPNALDAIHTWRFKPYLVDGKPVDVNTYVNFVFTLR